MSLTKLQAKLQLPDHNLNVDQQILKMICG